MEHIGIDLGGRESQVCIRTPDGKIIEEKRMATSSLEKFFKTRPPSRVVMETCSEAFAVAESAQRCGHQTRVVPATLVRSLGVGARGIKTDIRDARVQSEVSCRIDLPSVHIPSVSSRELKARLNMRDALVSARTQLINTVRSYLRCSLIRVRCTPETMPKKVRAYLEENPLGVGDFVERQLQVIETLNKQIKAADKELDDLVKGNETCRRFTTAPGVGPVTATRFLSTIDTPTRFTNAKSVASYLGLTPGEKSSSDKQRRTGLTKAGPRALRCCLVQAAWVIWRTKPHDPLCIWAKSVAERRGKQAAVCALARKLSGILWAMWRDERNYNATRVAV